MCLTHAETRAREVLYASRLERAELEAARSTAEALLTQHHDKIEKVRVVAAEKLRVANLSGAELNVYLANKKIADTEKKRIALAKKASVAAALSIKLTAARTLLGRTS